jgi:rubrerythrin
MILAVGPGSVQTQVQLHHTTQNNLRTALHEEAFTYVKYLLFAKHARDARHPDVAQLFERTADAERFQHLAEHAEQLGLIGDDANNLRDAIKDETYDVETMYKQFADEARLAGDVEVADQFDQVRRYELAHLYAFKAALAQLERTGTSR